MAATLAFDISTAKGTVRLTSGKLFRGGEYRLALTLDGTAVTNEVAMVRIYGDVRNDTRGDEICVAEATASDGYVVKTDTEAIEHLFTIHAGAEIVPVRVVVYVTEAIVADGRTMLYWSPTMAIVDGKPIDTRGEKGDDGYTPVKGKDYFDGTDGEPGPKGDDGHTPVKGKDYFDGKDGEDGQDGESAYQAAVRGGYTGDEATFIADLSKVSSVREEAERAEKAAEICGDLQQSCNGAAAAVGKSVATLNQDVTRISNLQTEVNQAIAEAISARDEARTSEKNAHASEVAADAVNTRLDKLDLEGSKETFDKAIGDATILINSATTAAGRAETAAGKAEAAQTNSAGSVAAVQALEASARNSMDAALEAEVQAGKNAKTAEEAAELAQRYAYGTEAPEYPDDIISAREFAEATEDAANRAEGSAASAKASATRAEIALNNGCVYEVRDVADATIGLDKVLTAYKHAPTGDTTYTFNAPIEAQSKIVVFWLWIVMGETAHALTFPSSVMWLSEPSFGANTQTLLALMSVDGGATWTANVQWEKPL